jgi:uncharacterized protein (DUF488 family)
VVVKLATIGAYGFDLDRFLAALDDADVGLLVDVRQRRGVRGHEYAWANAARLQAELGGAGIDYRHEKQLAPTTEMRKAQYRFDEQRGIGKRNRPDLAPEYRARYIEEILDKVDLDAFVESLPDGVVPALMCVERDAAACHRSLVAARIAERYGASVEHLVP